MKLIKLTVLVLVILFGCGRNTKQSNAQQDVKEEVINDTLTSDNAEIMQNSDNFLIGKPLMSAEAYAKEYGYDKFVFANIKKISFEENGNTFDIFLDTIVDGYKNKLDSIYHRIRIIKNNEKEVVFFNGDDWMLIEHIGTEYQDTLITDTKAVSIIQENSILLNRFVSIKKMGDNNLLLFAIGYNYSGSGGSLLTIINLTHFEKPTLIFNVPTDLFAVKDLDNDGVKDIIVEHFWNDPDEFTSERTEYYLKNGRFIKGISKGIKK